MHFSVCDVGWHTIPQCERHPGGAEEEIQHGELLSEGTSERQ